jgi:hypothetical protein
LEHQRWAFARTVTAVAVILVVTAAGTGYWAYDRESSGNGLRVINASTTVHGEPVFIGVCEAIAAPCPPSEMNTSLTVELISYNGAYYYVHNDTVVGGGTITETHTDATGGLRIITMTGSQSTVVYTAWFTNSTLYCVSPDISTAPTCPA